MSEIKGHPLSEAQKAVLTEMWEMVRRYQDEISPMEQLAMLAQVMGAVIAAANIDWDDKEMLTELISLNLDVGYQGMQAAIHEGAGHA